MTSQIKELIATLNRLIQTCKEAENGYRTAEVAVENLDLKTLLNSYAQQRAQYAAELQSEVQRLGGRVEMSSNLTDAPQSGGTNLKASVDKGNSAAVLAECERGEDSLKQQYQQALEKDLPPDVQAILERQFAGVKEAHDRIGTLEPAACDS
jgi:uncharacterized protein (TIGR02284 family)